VTHPLPAPLVPEGVEFPRDLRVALLLDETPFFHPQMTEELIQSMDGRVISILIVDRIPPQSDIRRYLIRNVFLLKPIEIARLGVRWLKIMLLPKPSWWNGIQGRFSSVRQVAARFGVQTISIKSRSDLLEAVEALRIGGIDVLVSSNSLILPQEVLSAPTLGCLNRHSALLPAYGGLWPVFQTVREGRNLTGVSVHDMTETIDDGCLRSQSEIAISSNQTLFEIYESTFQSSSQAIVRAIASLLANESVQSNGQTPSYFSMPTRSHWREFRKRGRRFV
jgi:folate-dependent phosphoribosylglycinamide formyltransferase PurN